MVPCSCGMLRTAVVAIERHNPRLKGALAFPVVICRHAKFLATLDPP